MPSDKPNTDRSVSLDSFEPKYDAFLSYSSVNRSLVRRIQRFLESYRPPNRAHRLRIYLDQTDMRGGSLPENISTALADSGALVVCWSENAAASEWVRDEISEFRRLGRETRIAIAHVARTAGRPKNAVFAGIEPLEHDLRKAWRAWFLTPRAKLELLRLIAFLTNVEMRSLRNWARRRLLRNLLLGFAVALLPLGAVLSFPLPHWHLLPLASKDPPIEPLACEVVDGKLWVATWSESAGEVSGARAFFVTYPDVLAKPEKRVERQRFFELRKRALPLSLIPQGLASHVRSVLDASGVNSRLEEISPREPPRIAQPGPGRFLLIQPIARAQPTAEELKWAAMDRLPIAETAGSIVVVYEQGSAPQASNVTDLSPMRWRERTPDNKRRTSPARGISVLWQDSGELWIGVPGEGEITGGLWHSSDRGSTWRRVDGFFNVTSLSLRPASGRGSETVLVAEQSFKRLHGTEFVQGSSRLVERNSDGAWIPSAAPPFDAASEIEICGDTPNGTLYVRVNNQVYERQSRPLYRAMMEAMGVPLPALVQR
jgi:hypothetical protein